MTRHVILSPVPACGPAALLALVCACGCTWELGGHSQKELAGVSGAVAKEHFGPLWPASVAPERVASVDFKSESSRDSSSAWCRIRLGKADARIWVDHLHAYEEASARNLATIGCAPEGVRREVAGPPLLRRQTGETPGWWSPPSVPFQATEVMVWHAGHDSGTARATYSAFDDSERTLWVSLHTCQHNRLWMRGELPDGQALTFVNAVTETNARPDAAHEPVALFTPSTGSRVPPAAVGVDAPDRATILEAVIRDILSDPDNAAARRFYGSPDNDRIALVQDSKVPWPAGFQPELPGVRFVRRPEPVWQDWSEPRLLGFRLDKFDLMEKPDIISSKSQIVIVMLNVGGYGDDAIRIGGHRFYYNVKRVEDGFEVVCAGSES